MDIAAGGAVKPAPPNRRFKAFLSYSRTDDRIAKWLHATLEAYRTPTQLLSSSGAFGVVAKRLSPVFRDRTDLSSGGELHHKLVEALKQSDFLVVLCSPASARSAYVNAEIESFLSEGRAASIMPVIVAGEPNSGDSATECLPPALKTLNLLASDLRDERRKDGKRIGDGREGGKFKLIAGMLGVPLDALLQRERRRQALRAAFSTGLSVVFLVLAMAAVGAAYVAYQNESEARRQTAAAQASADFLVSTFEVANPTTENPDTITARMILDRGAVRVRNQFSNEPSTKVRLIDAMARAYNRLGMIDSAQSLLQDHGSVMQSAGRDGVPAIVTLAETYRLHGQMDEALETTDQALRQAGSTRADADSLGLAWETRALVLHDMGRADESLASFQSAIGHFERSGNQGRRAHALTNQALVLTDMGSYEEARSALSEASAVFGVSPGPRSFEFGQSLLRLADNAYAAGNYAAAERFIARARPILGAILSSENPTLGDVQLLQGQIHTEMGNYGAAHSDLQGAIALYAAAYRSPHPSLGEAHYYLADLYLRQEQYEPAIVELGEAEAILIGSLGADHPNVGAMIVQRALALEGLERSREAAAACAQGLAIIEASMGSTSPMFEQAAQQCTGLSGG